MRPGQFSIDAADVSRVALEKARRAVYGMNSFRGTEAAFREKYFTRVREEYKLLESVAENVNFIDGNVLDAFFLAGALPYDVIFCRNLLIYLDRPSRELVVNTVDRLLAADGVLVVGHAETGQILGPGFVSVRYPRSFAYRKVDSAAQDSLGAFTSRRSMVTPSANQRQSVDRPSNRRVPVLETTTKAHEQPSFLETARRLADQGQLEEAAALCRRHLRERGASAQVYFLLGVVHHALRKEEQAAQFFNKAVYLEPDHYEALVHLALQRERQGDISGAAVLRQRAERSAKKTEPRA